MKLSEIAVCACGMLATNCTLEEIAPAGGVGANAWGVEAVAAATVPAMKARACRTARMRSVRVTPGTSTSLGRSLPVACEGVSRRPLILASGSPARLRLLRDAGFDPEVAVSGIDEDLPWDAPWQHVQDLAAAKAHAVAKGCERPDALVIGCDSMLLLDGEPRSKPVDAAEAVRRWQEMRGRSGALLTGHCLVDVASGRDVQEVADTIVRFGHPSDEEVAAYAATEEALSVAGPFTIDGRAAAFVDGIDGDAGNVIGISLPLLRELLGKLGVRVIDLWS